MLIMRNLKKEIEDCLFLREEGKQSVNKLYKDFFFPNAICFYTEN